MEDNQEVTDTDEGFDGDEIKNPKAVLAALERAKADAKKYREDAEALRSAVPKEDKYKDRAIKAEAKQSLLEKGVKNPERLLKHINLDDLDFDDDGNLAGLEGRLSELKTDFPELFSAKARAGSIDQFQEGIKPKKLTASELQAQQVLGD